MISNILHSLLLDGVIFFSSGSNSYLQNHLFSLTQLTQLKFNRETEAEADQVALQLLKKSGIGNQGLADFFDRQHKKGLKNKMDVEMSYLSTHPLGSERALVVKNFDGPKKSVSPLLTRKEWANLKNICTTP